MKVNKICLQTKSEEKSVNKKNVKKKKFLKERESQVYNQNDEKNRTQKYKTCKKKK